MAGREEWHAWLEKNHSTKSEIWLLFYKQHIGKPCISYDDALDEALCFGWVDSIVKRVDDERYLRKFTPRKSGSVWSEVNKKRVERLIREGRMAEAGLARVREAKESGEWFKRRVREKELKVPAFFEEALAANKKALENFNGLAPSYWRNMVGWVLSAKKDGTRRKRLAEVIRVLERGEKLGLKWKGLLRAHFGNDIFCTFPYRAMKFRNVAYAFRVHLVEDERHARSGCLR